MKLLRTTEPLMFIHLFAMTYATALFIEIALVVKVRYSSVRNCLDQGATTRPTGYGRSFTIPDLSHPLEKRAIVLKSLSNPVGETDPSGDCNARYKRRLEFA